MVGLSSGDYIAIDFALAYPSMVGALVAVASALSGYREWRDDLRHMWSTMEAALKQGDARRAQELELAMWVPLGTYPNSDARIRRLAEENRKVYLVDPDLERPSEPPAIDRLPEIRAPTLVVVAEHDLPDIDLIANRLVADIPRTNKVTIPSTDRLVNMRNSEMFNRVVLEFLERATI